MSSLRSIGGIYYMGQNKSISYRVQLSAETFILHAVGL